LFHHLKKGRPKDNLRGWVFRVGHNQALKRRRELRVGTVELPVLADPAANPEQQMVERLRQERMLQVVAALPERDRWCLYLRAEGLRYREIAATLGISLGTVASTLSRALERLGRVEAL
jgi:RNA polymerase sigma-70 factor, ECF subfamily